MEVVLSRDFPFSHSISVWWVIYRWCGEGSFLCSSCYCCPGEKKRSSQYFKQRIDDTLVEYSTWLITIPAILGWEWKGTSIDMSTLHYYRHLEDLTWLKNVSSNTSSGYPSFRISILRPREKKNNSGDVRKKGAPIVFLRRASRRNEGKRKGSGTSPYLKQRGGEGNGYGLHDFFCAGVSS